MVLARTRSRAADYFHETLWLRSGGFANVAQPISRAVYQFFLRTGRRGQPDSLCTLLVHMCASFPSRATSRADAFSPVAVAGNIRKQIYGGPRYDRWMARVGRASAENENLLKEEREHDARAIYWQEVAVDGLRCADSACQLRAAAASRAASQPRPLLSRAFADTAIGCALWVRGNRISDPLARLSLQLTSREILSRLPQF